MNHYPSFNDKVALVTEASSGMPLVIAQTSAEAGNSAVAADLNRNALV